MDGYEVNCTGSFTLATKKAGGVSGMMRDEKTIRGDAHGSCIEAGCHPLDLDSACRIMVACLRHPVELHAPVLPASSVPALRYIRQTGSTGFSTRMGTVVPTGKWALSNRLQSKYLMRR
jgi:hypothetical protein